MQTSVIMLVKIRNGVTLIMVCNEITPFSLQVFYYDLQFKMGSFKSYEFFMNFLINSKINKMAKFFMS
jgi:hypothetical protein